MLVFFKDHTHACTHTHTQPSHLTAFTFYHSGHSQHSVSDQGHSRLLQKVCREGEGGLVEVSKDENEWLSAHCEAEICRDRQVGTMVGTQCMDTV